MKSRKAKDIEKVLLQKGFERTSGKKKGHHNYLHLHNSGKKTHIYTYLSHGSKSKEYDRNLMGKIKKQLKFVDAQKAEDFLNCPMDGDEYAAMLKKLGEL